MEQEQWNLGQLIEALERVPAAGYVQFRFAHLGFGSLMSYRGYYDQPAIAPGDGPDNAAAVLAVLRAAVGASYEGYKGGNYVMDRSTQLWVAEYGRTSNTAVCGLTVEHDRFAYIETCEVGS
jgi:hypothetical protein